MKNTNLQLFEKIATLNNIPLQFSLNNSFQQKLDAFRNVTSKAFRYNNIDYPAVYLTDKDYGGLTIDFGANESLRLVINLEFYYVYGIFVGSELFAFKGEAFDALRTFGFQPQEIPYGDAYYDIDSGLSKKELEELKNTTANLIILRTAMMTINDSSISWEHKREAILITFWSLIEGIRFSFISNIINGLIIGKYEDHPYNDFYTLAEHWADLSVAAAEKGIYNEKIAVYELHRLEE